MYCLYCRERSTNIYLSAAQRDNNGKNTSNAMMHFFYQYHIINTYSRHNCEAIYVVNYKVDWIFCSIFFQVGEQTIQHVKGMTLCVCSFVCTGCVNKSFPFSFFSIYMLLGSRVGYLDIK